MSDEIDENHTSRQAVPKVAKFPRNPLSSISANVPPPDSRASRIKDPEKSSFLKIDPGTTVNRKSTLSKTYDSSSIAAVFAPVDSSGSEYNSNIPESSSTAVGCEQKLGVIPEVLVLSNQDAGTGTSLSGKLSHQATLPVNTLDEVRKKPNAPIEVAWGIKYRSDIYEHLKYREVLCKPAAGYMMRQPDMTHRMRAIVVGWMVDVAVDYELYEETFFLAVSMFDRFLSKMSVVRDKLQLLASVAILMASKLQELDSLRIDDIVHMSDKMYTEVEVLKMERIILRTLDWNLSEPTSAIFLRHIFTYGFVSRTVMFLAFFLSELSLLDGETFLPFLPSIAAAGAIAHARECLDFDHTWPESLATVTGYTLTELNEVIRCFEEVHVKCLTSELAKPVINKYERSEFDRVSTLYCKLAIEDEDDS